MKTKTIVCPAEYIDKDDNLVKTLMTANDKNGNLFVVCKTEVVGKNLIILSEDLLTNYDLAIDGKRIETPEDEVHLDDELDIFQSFQDSIKEETGEFKLNE